MGATGYLMLHQTQCNDYTCFSLEVTAFPDISRCLRHQADRATDTMHALDMLSARLGVLACTKWWLRSYVACTL